MTDTVLFEAGGYRYIPLVFQYSAGVAATPGQAIERVRFQRHLPLDDGFAAIEAHLKQLGRPLTALAGVELRSPEPMTDQGFDDFNRRYVQTLEQWGLVKGDVNPVARTNVCPVRNPPSAPAIAAFSYTVPHTGPGIRTFVLSGVGNARPGPGPYKDRIVCPNDMSPDGVREKILFVVDALESRLTLLERDWSDATGTQIYGVNNVGDLVDELIVDRGAVDSGLLWVISHPPVIGLDLEMDTRGIGREHVI